MWFDRNGLVRRGAIRPFLARFFQHLRILHRRREGGGQDDDLNAEIGQAADPLRALSGLFGQAARSAMSL